MNLESSIIDLYPWTLREFHGGQGPPVILLHGLSGSFEWWARNVEALAAKHRVAGIDLVGFGSQRRFVGSPLPLDWEESVTLLRRWIETRIGEPVHVIGHSMGGQLAIHLAAAHPEVVRSLVLVSSSGLPVHLTPGPHLRAMFRPPRSLVSFLPVLLRDAFRAGPTSIGLALSRILRDDVRPLLSRVSAPALLVWGENDPLVPLRYAKLYERMIPRARLEVLPQAGHIPMWDRPAEFNRIVLEHLASVEQGQPIETTEPRFNWAVQGIHAGICHRASGDRADVVLIHGLGILSAYFRELARALWDRRLHAIAPDLPGFGYSRNVRVGGLDELVEQIAAWGDAHGLEGRIWLGHSTGAQIVERLARLRPDLVRRSCFVSPIWNHEALSTLWLAQGIIRDGPKESPHLLLLALHAYWDAGLIRLLRSFRWYGRDAVETPRLPNGSAIVYGESDPLVQPDLLTTLGADVHVVPGAHAVVFSSAEDVAEIVSGLAVRHEAR